MLIKFRNWTVQIMKVPNSKFSHNKPLFKMINLFVPSNKLLTQSMQAMATSSVINLMLLLVSLSVTKQIIQMNKLMVHVYFMT